MGNPFLDYAVKAAPYALKKQARKVERETSKAQQKAVLKAVIERDQLTKLWKAWRRDRLTEELEGPYRKQLQVLVDFLEKMTLQEEPKLLKLMCVKYWRKAPEDIRYLTLRLISTRIVTLREKAELPPFDDALPGEPLTVYQTIRNDLMEPTNG